jgi:hypothetical protein
MAERVRVDGSHWDSKRHNSKPVGFVLNEACLRRFEAKYNVTTDVTRRHVKLMSDAGVAHICRDGARRRPRQVTLIPIGIESAPCPGCRRLMTDEVQRSDRRSSTVTAAKPVGQEGSKTDADQRESPDPALRTQPGKDHGEGTTAPEEDDRYRFTLAETILFPVETLQKFAALDLEMREVLDVIYIGKATEADQARYVEITDELDLLQRAMEEAGVDA